MKAKHLTALMLSVLLCAGCRGTEQKTEPTSPVSVTTTNTEEISVPGETSVEQTDEPDERDGDIETVETDAAGELITELQTSGQLIHADDYCQIRYFGEMKADNGEAVIVLGYSKFHGGLVRILNNGFCCGDIVDGGALWFSPMNTFTDGYWCHSGTHGWEFYDDPSEQWWTDNEFIYLRCPSGGTEVDTEEKAGYAEYAAVQGKFMMYDDSVYDGVSKLGLYLTDLRIQEAVEGNFETKEPPYFAEPSNENVHVCTSEYDTQVIRVRFDPDKADLWAHT